ncbi:DUF202 domain-containing protein [Gordonia sp. PDNC005]|uniref:YidH family protein n=1 Tax=unclassified Gordonia (in: high G+C Gram-positive bacteria) TaxID=2657482 RepID=UPI001963CFB1|nr:DUF202 domain-containing protein [Gordonia sp. PDNC005]QRY62184.1 DUF202 domain-containing protein [Gordonia sp. PDNC005]
MTERPPGSVDARFTMAAERTLLAWLRTALGLLAAGVAVLHVVGDFASPALQTTLGVALVLLGGASAAVGAWRWQRVTRALSDGGPMPGPVGIWLLVGAFVVLSVVFAVAR